MSAMMSQKASLGRRLWIIIKRILGFIVSLAVILGVIGLLQTDEGRSLLIGIGFVIVVLILLFLVIRYFVPWFWIRVLRPLVTIMFWATVVLGIATFFFVQAPVGQKMIPEWLQVVLVGTAALWSALRVVNRFTQNTTT